MTASLVTPAIRVLHPSTLLKVAEHIFDLAQCRMKVVGYLLREDAFADTPQGCRERQGLSTSEVAGHRRRTRRRCGRSWLLCIADSVTLIGTCVCSFDLGMTSISIVR